jgi:hypothetical protein
VDRKGKGGEEKREKERRRNKYIYQNNTYYILWLIQIVNLIGMRKT